MSRNRIDAHFAHLKSQQRKAFVAYLVAGDPSLDLTIETVLALDAAGVDVIELGVPFSDPVADGVVNQLGSARALNSGTNVAAIFDAVKRIRQQSSIPIVLFTYYNPVFIYGTSRFSTDAVAAGVDGVLVLDLPPEELAGEWEFPDELRRISLIAPTTPPARIRQICENSSGFIYYVSREGVTGMQDSLPPNIEASLRAIRDSTPLPICVGFGISNPEQAAAVARFADGVVVGSAIVHRMGEWGSQSDLPNQVASWLRPMVDAINRPNSLAS